MYTVRLSNGIGMLAAVMFLLGTVGCSNKGKYAGKVTVVVGESLKAKGVECGIGGLAALGVREIVWCQA